MKAKVKSIGAKAGFLAPIVILISLCNLALMFAWAA
jgi:hypothetical protein